jgi:hypothetical protein
MDGPADENNVRAAKPHLRRRNRHIDRALPPRPDGVKADVAKIFSVEAFSALGVLCLEEEEHAVEGHGADEGEGEVCRGEAGGGEAMGEEEDARADAALEERDGALGEGGKVRAGGVVGGEGVRGEGVR